MSTYSPQSWFGLGEFFAPNPEWNAVIAYYVRDAASGSARIDIKDADGTVIRSLQGPARQGLNQVVWDLRYERPVTDAGPALGGRGGRGGGGGPGSLPNGPLVLPGKYAVAVTIPGVTRELRGDVAVEPDPLVMVADRDRRARQVVLLTIYNVQKTLGAARAAVRSLVAQTEAFRKDAAAAGTPDATARVDSLVSRIGQLQGDVERAMGTVSSLSRSIEGWPGPPTVDQRAQLDAALGDASNAVDALNRLTQTEIPALYSQILKRDWSQKVQAVPAVKKP
jgi:hypothetical protein